MKLLKFHWRLFLRRIRKGVVPWWVLLRQWITRRRMRRMQSIRFDIFNTIGWLSSVSQIYFSSFRRLICWTISCFFKIKILS